MHHSSEAANRWVFGMFVRLFHTHTKHLCGGDCDMWGAQRGTASELPPSAAEARHGWSNRGEECERVNSYNAELCSSLVLLSVHFILWLLLITPAYLVFFFLCGLDLVLCAELVFTKNSMKKEEKCLDCFSEMMLIWHHFKIWHEMYILTRSTSNFSTTVIKDGHHHHHFGSFTIALYYPLVSCIRCIYWCLATINFIINQSLDDFYSYLLSQLVNLKYRNVKASCCNFNFLFNPINSLTLCKRNNSSES